MVRLVEVYSASIKNGGFGSLPLSLSLSPSPSPQIITITQSDALIFLASGGGAEIKKCRHHHRNPFRSIACIASPSIDD